MNTALDIASYGPVINQILEHATRCPLNAGRLNLSPELLTQLTVDSAFAHTSLQDPYSAEACVSGLWLLSNGLDQSHDISQDLKQVEGSFWHAIMHRREGDYWNAKYWFRKVREHAIYPELAAAAEAECEERGVKVELEAAFSGKRWRPENFVDLVEQYCGTGTTEEAAAKAVQEIEWQLLFDYCYRRAVGGY